MTVPFGALVTGAAQSRAGYLGGQQQGQQDALSRALLLSQEQRKSQQEALADALTKARIGNYESMSADRAAKDAADPVTHAIPVQDGTYFLQHKSGKRERVDANGNPVGVQQASQVAPPRIPEAADVGRADHIPEPEPQAPTQQAPAFGKPPGPPKPDATKVHAANRLFDVEHPLPQTPDRVLVQTIGPTGQPVYTPRGQAAGQQAPLTGGGAGMIRGFGQGGVFGAGSGIGSVEEMKSVLPNMKDFEGQVAQGKQSMNGWDTFREGLISHARANKGFIDQGKVAGLLQQLAATNPALMSYATDKLAWVMADLNLSRGSSDERGRLATIVDGLDLPVGAMDPTARANYIARMQQRRDARLSGLVRAAGTAGTMLNEIDQRLGGGRGGSNPNPDNKPGPINLSGPPTSGQKVTAAERAQLKQMGFTDAQITAKYGPP